MFLCSNVQVGGGVETRDQPFVVRGGPPHVTWSRQGLPEIAESRCPADG
jgi:hypothetical protein